MAEKLTQKDIDHLSALVGNGFEQGVDNRDQYYRYLEERGYQYGGLAGGVVREDSVSGRIANAFLAETAAQSGSAINLSDSLRISYDLMVADFEARAALVDQQGFSGELSAVTHYNNHKNVFSDPKYGLGIENWTAAEPIEYYIENYSALGFETPDLAATQIMSKMMNADLVIEMFVLNGALEGLARNPGATFSSRQGLLEWIAQTNYVSANNPLYIGTGVGTPFDVESHCFLGDTLVQMWPLDPSFQPGSDGSYEEELVLSHVWHKPISEVEAGDVVVAFDDTGRLQPGKVARTMTNDSTHILDFWGTGVTPGHACYCADGPFEGRHVPIMDILRTDGGLMRADGTVFRAATNCEVGSLSDLMIHASATAQQPDGSWSEPRVGQVRFGTRVVLPNGRHTSLQEIAEAEGWRVSNDGYMVRELTAEDGAMKEQKFLFPYLYGEALPKPEDYILARSNVTLEAIYAAGEWEQIGTNLSAPDSMVGLNTNHTSSLFRPSKPAPNIPSAFSNHPDAPEVKTQKALS
ncbi:MAG: hypothetical protein ACU0BN_07250 [Sulfitobacter sp.]